MLVAVFSNICLCLLPFSCLDSLNHSSETVPEDFSLINSEKISLVDIPPTLNQVGISEASHSHKSDQVLPNLKNFVNNDNGIDELQVLHASVSNESAVSNGATSGIGTVSHWSHLALKAANHTKAQHQVEVTDKLKPLTSVGISTIGQLILSKFIFPQASLLDKCIRLHDIPSPSTDVCFFRKMSPRCNALKFEEVFEVWLVETVGCMCVAFLLSVFDLKLLDWKQVGVH